MVILCATDFSDASESALAAAGAIASRIGGAVLWVLHACHPPRPDCAGERSPAAHALAEVCERLSRTWGISVEPLLREGEPVAAIAATAREQEAKLVVIGSGGHPSEPLRHTTGVSERLAVTLRAPVLVVRRSAPFEAWARGERVLRLLLGIDESTSWEGALGWTSRLREAGPCDVVVGHVYYASEARKRYGLRPLDRLDRPDTEVEGLLARDMAQQVGRLPGLGAVAFRPKHGIGRLGDHLIELARDEGADLLTLGTHRKTGFARLASVPSVALHEGDLNVLLAPAGEAVLAGVPPPTRILVPTDLSAFGNRAIGHAHAVLDGRSGEVIVLHVEPKELQQWGDDQRAAKVVEPYIPDATTARTTIEIVDGADPAKTICDTAERLGVDMICLSTERSGGLLRALSASIADRVVHESRRPVLVVHPPPE